jgi:hypothetical protein
MLASPSRLANVTLTKAGAGKTTTSPGGEASMITTRTVVPTLTGWDLGPSAPASYRHCSRSDFVPQPIPKDTTKMSIRPSC